MEKKIKDQILKAFADRDGFTKNNNINILEIEDNYAKLEAEITDISMNPNGTVHGGLLFGLADTAMGIAACTNGRNVCTLNSQIDYLRPGLKGKLIAIAEKIKVGKTVSVYRCNIYDDKDKHIASCTGTYYFID